MQLFLKPAQIFPSYIALAIAILNLNYCNKESNPATPTPGNGITVLSPNGNATYHVGDTMKITWNLADTSVAGLELNFSSDGGASYVTFCLIQPAFPEFQNREVLWVIPDSIGNGSQRRSICSNSCRIWIRDYFDYSIGDVSDKLFSILAK